MWRIYSRIREGSIWADLGRMGLIPFATDPLPFKRIPHLASAEGTAEPFVGAIYEDVRESYGSVRSRHSTRSIAEPANTLPTAGRLDRQSIPM